MGLILELLGISLPGLAIWAAVTGSVTAVIAGFNAWYGTLDWFTFALLSVCLGLALLFFLIERPGLLFLVAGGLVAATWTYSYHKGQTDGIELGRQEGVKIFQRALGVAADGFYGHETKAAMDKFTQAAVEAQKTIHELMEAAKSVQEALGVETDGYIGHKTLAAIKALQSSKTPPTSLKRKPVTEPTEPFNGLQ